jgi:phage terminase small subunit
MTKKSEASRTNKPVEMDRPAKSDGCRKSKEAVKARHDLFIEAYVENGGNGAEAARAAGYSGSNLVLSQSASRALACPYVQEELAKRRAALSEKYALRSDDVIKSIAQAIYFDPRKLFNQDGTLKAIHELDDDTALMIASVETVQVGSEDSPAIVKKIKWESKATARDQAMRHLGLYEKDNRQRTDPQAVLNAMATTELVKLREALLNPDKAKS